MTLEDYNTKFEHDKLKDRYKVYSLGRALDGTILYKNCGTIKKQFDEYMFCPKWFLTSMDQKFLNEILNKLMELNDE